MTILLNTVKNFLRYLPFVIGVTMVSMRQYPAWADTETDGIALFKQGHFTEALPVFEALAQRENVKAAYYLGLMHYFGYGTHPDPAMAKHWFSKASRRGHAASQIYLGELLIVEKQYLSAYMWLELGVQQGQSSGKKYLTQLTTAMNVEAIERAHEMALKCKNSQFEECD